MMKFNDNNNTFLIISMTFFYFNKDFHFHIKFNLNTTDYKTTHQCIEIKKMKNIIIWMNELLIFDHQQLKKIKQIIEIQMNKHKINIIYEVSDQIWLNFKNIKIMKFCKNLKDKWLNLYSITVKVKTFYWI